MRELPRGEIIELMAKDPGGDLACDFTLAKDAASVRTGLEQGILGPPRQIEDGVEVSFRADAWDAVRRYVEMESRCCAFLNLAAEQNDHGVILRVTGRDDAQEFIRNIFAS